MRATFRDALPANPKLVAVPVGISEPGNAGTMIGSLTRWAPTPCCRRSRGRPVQIGKCLVGLGRSIFHLSSSNPTSSLRVEVLRAAGLAVLATTPTMPPILADADLSGPDGLLSFGPEA